MERSDGSGGGGGLGGGGRGLGCTGGGEKGGGGNENPGQIKDVWYKLKSSGGRNSGEDKQIDSASLFERSRVSVAKTKSLIAGMKTPSPPVTRTLPNSLNWICNTSKKPIQ